MALLVWPLHREEALACYDRALEIDPCYALAWHNKGEALHCLLRHEEALACFEHRLDLDPHYAQAWYNKARVLDALGRREEAREARKTAERLGKEDSYSVIVSGLRSRPGQEDQA